ncbi:MAG: long-chain fatty acid--CoA ligase [Gammaproteobacteria bacterium]|nr:long-chain fatty acid--CoA ligase [Gammaproteobacteria bacterium]
MLGLMMDTPLTITGILRHAAENHPGQAVVSITADHPRHRTTYGAVFARAAQLAHALDRLGVPVHGRVATLAWNDFRHLELFYGVACAGRVLHTVNPRLTPEQIAWIINDGGATVLFAAPEFAPLLAKVTPQLTAVKLVVWLTGPGHLPPVQPAPLLGAAGCYEQLLEGEPARYDWPALDERAASALCHTSGTTGNPKGVLYSHRSTVLHALSAMAPDVIGVRALDAVLPVVPMFHVNAWGVPFVAPMAGAKLVLPGRGAGDPATLVDLINGEQVTLALGVPTVWLALLQHLAATGQSLPTLKRSVVGGAACPPAVMDEFRERHGVETHHAWGMTETSPLGTFNTPKPGEDRLDREAWRALRAKQGRGVYGVELRIVNDDGDVLPRDGRSAGALQVRGPFIASGYFGTGPGDSHTADGWFTTGDVATIDPAGYLQITDRTKDVIKSGGEWISSIELENLATGHPAVAEAAVIGVPHAKWSERPLLVVVRKPGESVAGDELLGFLAGKVAKWWVPDDVVFVPEIPHTGTGKISKRDLRDRFREHYQTSGTDGGDSA